MTTQRINEKVGALLLGGMTRDQLSKELGMTKRSLYNRTSGKSKWEWEEVVRLSNLADCTLEELVDVKA
jgi:DNA-binding XRE family transcriptional regulator